MEDTMKVLKLLEELEDIVDEATGLPLSNKIMVDAEEIFQIVREIRLALPDDVQQAKWIRDERDRILEEAKTEYERIIREAKKQADYLVETDDITLRATKLAGEIKQDAETHARVMRMRTYDYVDKMLYDMQGVGQTVDNVFRDCCIFSKGVIWCDELEKKIKRKARRKYKIFLKKVLTELETADII